MINYIKSLMEKREEGFTLIELLVVVIIIGILAAIAIPVFLNQRNGARDASVKSDINATAKMLESGYTDNNAYPGQAAVAGMDFVISPGNTVEVEYFTNTGAAPADVTGQTVPGAVSYQICGYNDESNKVFEYDSADGGLNGTSTASDGATTCTAGDLTIS